MGKSRPIGLFDSGVGGLTVAHALHTMLPQEQLVYFGDTVHLPYGDKSKETIVQYSLGIADFLLKQKCKVILIACNTASANAFEEVRDHVGNKAVVMNVIDPVVSYVCTQNEGLGTIGIIGTKATIDSGTYEKKIREEVHRLGQKAWDEVRGEGPGGASEQSSGTPEQSSGKTPEQSSGKTPEQSSGNAPVRRQPVQVNSLATPLLVPMIEEGFVFDDISNAIIRSYLSRKELEGIDSLILGCTHYPIIRNQISRFFNFEVNVHDTAQIVAKAVQRFLTEHDMLCTVQAAENQFYVSDHTPYFEVIANMFFNEKIHLEKLNIWK